MKAIYELSKEIANNFKLINELQNKSLTYNIDYTVEIKAINKSNNILKKQLELKEIERIFKR